MATAIAINVIRSVIYLVSVYRVLNHLTCVFTYRRVSYYTMHQEGQLSQYTESPVQAEVLLRLSEQSVPTEFRREEILQWRFPFEGQEGSTRFRCWLLLGVRTCYSLMLLHVH